MSDGLPAYAAFYDRLIGAPWQAQAAPDGKGFVVLSGFGCGCMALGEPMVTNLPEYDAKVIANAPEALALLLQAGRHLAATATDAKGKALAEDIRAMFADLMK